MHNKVILAAIGSFAAATIVVLFIGEFITPPPAQPPQTAFLGSKESERKEPELDTVGITSTKTDPAKAPESSVSTVNMDRSSEAQVEIQDEGVSTHPPTITSDKSVAEDPSATPTDTRRSPMSLLPETLNMGPPRDTLDNSTQRFAYNSSENGTTTESGGSSRIVVDSKRETPSSKPAHIAQVPSPEPAKNIPEFWPGDAPDSAASDSAASDSAASDSAASDSAASDSAASAISNSNSSVGLDTLQLNLGGFRRTASGVNAQFVQSSSPPAAGGNNEQEGEEAETLGVPPPKEEPAFLRKRSILLAPGQYQIEYGVRYGVDASTFPVAGLLQSETNQVQIANANQKRRLLTTPLELRVGISENLQAFMSMPLGWSSQSLSIGNIQQDNDNIGIGDLSLGLTKVLWAPKKKNLRVLSFLQTSAPTGDSNIALTQQAREASLGAGYWTLTSGINITESHDPLVLFSSVGYTYTFGTELDGDIKLNAGNTLFYTVGAGYSVNSKVTVSASFSGASTGNAQLDGVATAGTRSEPFTLRLAGTISDPNKQGKTKLARTREPFLRFGLTSLANDVEFGMRWTY